MPIWQRDLARLAFDLDTGAVRDVSQVERQD